MKKIVSMVFCSLALVLPFAVCACGDSTLEKNKSVVLSFYEKLINQKDFKAASDYIGKEYIQHNPMAADGVIGLKNFVQYLRDNYPYSHSEIKHVYADKDVVILHVHSMLIPNTKGRAIVDIFRLQNNKIVEHWDVIQEIPEKSANDNGMF